YAFVLARGKSIDLQHLPERIVQPDLSLSVAMNQSTGGVRLKAGISEKEALLEALKKSDGNQSKAAKILGVSRVTVWKRMKKYGIVLEKNSGA
ncbi:MAG: sigma-54-dependent Fis family transcriptional regulator, partial [Desulfobacteraceae bacterium]|nr:sigma-54-dependent Fis family transcriptional regulator [Desulfobacteraceae bacterium]